MRDRGPAGSLHATPQSWETGTVHDVSVQGMAGLDEGALTELNREPVAFLAELATRHGVPFAAAFYRAQTVVLDYGTSRRIDADGAFSMIASMLEWAQQYRHVRPAG
jgi:hypothetical protein